MAGVGSRRLRAVRAEDDGYDAERDRRGFDDDQRRQPRRELVRLEGGQHHEPQWRGVQGIAGTPNTISIVGGYQQAATGQFSPTPTTGAASVPDPLVSLPVPLPCTAPGALPAPDCALGNQTSVNVSGSADVTLSPGVYSSIKSSSTGTITMQPGIYVITSTLTLNKSPAPGKTSLVAPGVLLYFACNAYPTPCAPPGATGADFSMTGGATVSISSPTSGSWQGVSLFFDRTNTGTLKLTGSSASSVSGSIYLKSGGTTLTGSSGVFTLDSLIVTSTLTKTGDSGISVSFDPGHNFPGLDGQVHLTE